MQGLNATGRIGVGDQDALRMIGRPVLPIDSDKGIQSRFLQEPSAEDIAGVEQRYLARGDTKVFIVVPTKDKAVDGLPCLEGLELPGEYQFKVFNAWGKTIAENYNLAATLALKEGCDYLFCLEDDTFPPADALTRLLATGLDIVGAWYPKRLDKRTGASIELVEGRRVPMVPDGTIKEAYALSQGCTLISTKVFSAVLYPWFVTTDHLTQDSFFSQRARDAGYKLWCDTSILCLHIDRETGREYV
jgi:hypothetical protein